MTAQNEKENMLDFCKRMPKIELHAHINGSISENTMKRLLKMKNRPEPEEKFSLPKDQKATLEDCFGMFKLIHQISDTTEAAYTITYDVIHEFAADNVKYLELRTTPREVAATGMTKNSYIESVIKAIQDCEKENLDIIVKLILAIDRRNGIKAAEETVELAKKFKSETKNIVVGVDLSGDPTVGNASDFIPVFKEAKNNDLKLALHLAEVPAIQETIDVLQQAPPDRIGHGTCLHPEAGGTEELVQLVLKNNIPIEFCLTSNLIGQTVLDVANHQFIYWYEKSHLCAICTDDKGVFNTSLSEEFEIAANAFNLSSEDLFKVSFQSIEYIFADEDIKETLRKKFKDFK